MECIFIYVCTYVLVNHRKLLLDIDHILAEIAVSIHKIANGIAGMVYGSVVLASELRTDRGQRCFGEIAA